jgi:hypothetical protein
MQMNTNLASRLHAVCCKGDHNDGMFNVCNWYYELSDNDDSSVWERPAHKLWSEKVRNLMESGSTEDELNALLAAREKFAAISKTLGE